MSEVQKVFLYRFLPMEVREFFLERGWEDLEVIQQRYGLAPQSVDTLDQIQQEILFGYEPIDKVENLIRTRLKYDEVLTRRVAMDFIEMRFLPLDSYLQSAPFRLYAALGGNTTVLRIASVSTDGLTAARVRNIQEAFLEELRQENAKRMKQGDTNVGGVIDNAGTSTNGDDVDNENALTDNAELSDENDEPVTTVVSEISDDTSITTVVPETPNEHSIDTEDIEDDATLHTPEEHTKIVPMVEPLSEVVVLPNNNIASNLSSEAQTSRRAKEDSQSADDAVQQVQAIANMDAALDAKEPQANPVNTESKPKTALDTLIARDAAEVDVLAALKQGSKTVGVAEHPGVQKVRDACELSLLAPDLEKRLRVLIGSRLSGVRKQEALLSALTKPVDQGGVGFDSAIAMRIGSLVADEVMGSHKASLEKTQTEKKAFVEARQAVWQPSPKEKSLQGTASNPAGSTVVPQDSPPRSQSVSRGARNVHETTSLAALASSPSPILSSVASAKEDSRLLSTDPQRSSSSAQSGVGPAPRIVSTKVPMTDIQAPPRKLTGPVEELGTMTLVNFRRMPGGLEGALRAVEEQIERMSTSDPALSLRAMSAWMQSPLVLEYRRLLSTALQAGIPLERILRDPIQNPQGFLSEEMQGLRVFHAKMRAHG